MTRALVTIAALVLLLPQARAQQPEVPGEVVITLDSFGIRGLARPADWVGIRLQVTDRGAEPREVMLRIDMTDADGDHPTLTRTIATNPGVTQGVWLYGQLPPKHKGTFKVVANAAISNDDATFRPGRLLGTGLITPTGQLPRDTNGLIAILGQDMMGLSQYSNTYRGSMYPPVTHEQIIFSKDLTPNDLPDRAVGLACLDAIIWAEADPIELTSERAEAIRQWVRAGGHLVVVLPVVGQSWYNNRNPLIDILPIVQIERLDEQDLEPYRPLLSDRPRDLARLPSNATVHRITPREGARASDAAPILLSPEGFPVVVRRIYGLGAVTVVGIDLGARALQNAIDPDVFWHRVLGKRGDLLTDAEMTDITTNTQTMFQSRSSLVFDDEFDAEIAKTGRAAAGVLLGFVIFVLFWVIAGPGGFAVLKATGKTRHAWVAYAGVTALFTVIAWGGATAIRPSKVDVTYLRIVDHVNGQPVQRARIWASVLIPFYGDATISIGEPDDASDNRIAPWRSPSDETAAGGFPDARAYDVRANDLAEITVPTRATVKEVMGDWVGPPAWAMPIPVAAEGQEVGVIRLIDPAEPLNTPIRPGYSRPELSGVLVHDLPTALEDIVIIVVKGQTELDPPRTSQLRLPGGQLLADASAFHWPRWEPGDALDLQIATSIQVNQDNRAVDRSARSYLDRLAPNTPGTIGQGVGMIDITSRLTALALYSVLEPPGTSTQGGTTAPIIARTQTHGLDLGIWFTQPCVIMIGHMPDLRDPTGGPAEIFVDGRPAPMRGRTVVKWVYPLPPNPPEYPPAPVQPAFSPAPGE
jgi:hypothetical protein